MKYYKFNVGDEVKYISGYHGDTTTNPLWNGIHGQIVGTITDRTVSVWALNALDAKSHNTYRIKWNNNQYNYNQYNSYRECDIELIKPKISLDEDLFTI